MKVEVDNKIIGMVISAISVAFAVFFYMNSIHIENHEMEVVDKDFRTRVLMSESTRYAEIAKYYRDEMKSRDLTEAEWARLELVEKQQCRIRNQLANNPTELCD